MPLPKAELLFEGSYLYYQNGINYSQENFKVLKVAETNFIQINAEILSRIETGEFLKVLVRFEMNQHQLPVFVEIEKSIGNKHALESFKIDTITQELRYSFQGSEGQHNSSKPINARHYLNSPALSTAGVFTLTKKFDATGRTPVFLINSNNDWTFEAPPSEKVIYVEYSARDMEDFKLNNNTLTANHLCMYEYDSTHTITEKPVELFLSKHYGIPYQLLHEDRKIVIRNLKKHT